MSDDSELGRLTPLPSRREEASEPDMAPPAIVDRTIPTTCIEHAYGSTFRLSFQIKVF